MSTRKILKDRRKFFLYLIGKGADGSEGMKKAVDEIDFILEKLKEYSKINKTL